MITVPHNEANTVVLENQVTEDTVHKGGRPYFTYKMQDYAINFTTYLMMEIFGHGK